MKDKRFFATSIAYVAKAKDTTPKEMWLFWTFGRKIEPLENVDFNRN